MDRPPSPADDGVGERDEARAHQCSIARRNGAWEFLETPELTQAKQEIKKLNGALDILSKPFPGHKALTPRERVALGQIVSGSSSKEAARRLGISPRTVEFHRANVMRKLGAKNTADLVRKHKMIVEQAVSNDVLDMGLLQCTAEPAREILEVEKIDVVADKGYFRTEDIASCEEAGLTPHVPRPQRGAAVKNGFFRKDEFRYDAKPEHLHLSRRAGADADPRRQTARIEKSRLRQCKSLPRLRVAAALHEGCSRCLTPRKRGRARSHGGAAEGEAGDSRPASRDRRASLRQHQAMDESGRLLMRPR